MVEKLRKMKLTPLSEGNSETDHRNLCRRFTLEQIQALAARYGAGETATSLCRDLKASHQALRRLFEDEVVSPRRQGMEPADADRAVQLYESGMTIVQVTERVGYS